MAEDGTSPDLGTTDEEPASERRQNRQSRKTEKSQRPRSHKRSPKPKCRSRIDELATPSRRIILALYQEHASHLPKEKIEKVKELLQQLYAMTPDETEKYFEHLKQNARQAERRKDIKYMLKKLLKKRKKAKQTSKAYEFIYKLLIRGIEYASKHPMPPLVSVRLRNLSNIILEQLCDLRNIKIPNREYPTPIGIFFIQVADWMAIAVEHLYYGVQLKKNRELEKLENEAKAREKDKDKLKIHTLDDEKHKPLDDEEEQRNAEAVLSEPLNLSEIE